MNATPCKYFSTVASNDGGHCGFFSGTVSYGVCQSCKFNTDPDTWPPNKVNRKKMSPVKGCGCKPKQ